MIIGDLFLPWRTGEGRLFTREHFRAVQRALRPGGLFCQWLPMYQLTERQFAVIARTFSDVFPNAFIVRGDFYADTAIFGLIGGRALKDIDWNAVAQSHHARPCRSVYGMCFGWRRFPPAGQSRVAIALPLK